MLTCQVVMSKARRSFNFLNFVKTKATFKRNIILVMVWPLNFFYNQINTTLKP